MSATVSPGPATSADRTEPVGASTISRRPGGRNVFSRLRRKPKPAEPPAIDWFAA